jgi:hypothetical protein
MIILEKYEGSRRKHNTTWCECEACIAIRVAGNPFKKGDRVRCITAPLFLEDDVTVGKVFEVKGLFEDCVIFHEGFLLLKVLASNFELVAGVDI